MSTLLLSSVVAAIRDAASRRSSACGFCMTPRVLLGKQQVAYTQKMGALESASWTSQLGTARRTATSGTSAPPLAEPRTGRQRKAVVGSLPNPLGALHLVAPRSSTQRKGCSSCGDEGSCPTCQAKSALSLAPPPAATQARRGNPSDDPAERQADDLGKQIADDLPGSGSVGHGALPDDVRGVAEGHLGVSLAGTHLDASSGGHRKAEGQSALAVTEGRNIAFGNGLLNTTSREGRELLGHELVHVGQQGAAGKHAAQRAAMPEEVDAPAGAAAPEGDAAKEKAPTKARIAVPKTETITFEGQTLADDVPYLKQVLEDVATAKKGLGGAKEFVTSFELGHTYKTLGGIETAPFAEPASGDARAAISRSLRTALSDLTTERDTMLVDFVGRARAALLGVLTATEKQADEEEIRYGLTKIRRSIGDGGFGDSGKPGVRASADMVDSVTTRGMLGAAKDLATAQKAVADARAKVQNTATAKRNAAQKWVCRRVV